MLCQHWANIFGFCIYDNCVVWSHIMFMFVSNSVQVSFCQGRRSNFLLFSNLQMLGYSRSSGNSRHTRWSVAEPSYSWRYAALHWSKMDTRNNVLSWRYNVLCCVLLWILLVDYGLVYCGLFLLFVSYTFKSLASARLCSLDMEIAWASLRGYRVGNLII